MYIIGISAFYHDSSVCLFRNDQLIFACEEEKFTGIKHDSSFPEKTLNYIFKKYKIQKNEIESVCYYENPRIKLNRVIKNLKKNIFNSPLYCIKSYLTIKKNIKYLDKRLNEICPNVFYSTHHEAHQYYSFYSSPFDKSVCLSVDGVGEIDTLSMGETKYNGILYTPIAEYPNSLGLFYSAMTSFLGFRPNEGEYKVMGLASYGNPVDHIDKVRKLIRFKNGRLECNMDVFCWDRSDRIMFNEKLPSLLEIDQRLPNEKLEKIHENLAASVQKVYEEILFNILKMVSLCSESGNLCLSGGCAYNGTANGKITSFTNFKHLWIPPAPSDAGSTIGSCVHYMVKIKKNDNKITRNPFLGPEYNVDDYTKYIKSSSKTYKILNESKIRSIISKELLDGKVVGWFQGHIEFGARALGNRSILANPTVDGMKDKINRVIKKREGFRPFAPMVVKEKQHLYFDVTDDVPYMNQVVKVKPEYVDKLKAVTHVDGTARIQTVYEHTRIHELLIDFEKLSGFPILLNTSFNVKDKTMVLTPKDAIDTFYDTEMDILVMGNYIIYKS